MNLAVLLVSGSVLLRRQKDQSLPTITLIIKWFHYYESFTMNFHLFFKKYTYIFYLYIVLLEILNDK